MTLHDWPAWMDRTVPVTGPTASPSQWLHVGIHYTAADNLIDGDPGEAYDRLDDYLRSMQAAYVRVRGYSLGYNWAVDWLGGIWRIRGWRIRSAAHAGANHHAPAILMLVDGADPATDEAVDAARGLIADAERLAGRQLSVHGHNELPGRTTPTGCCGAGMRGQIAAGLFSPRWRPPQDPPAPSRPVDPPVPQEDDEMLPIVTNAEASEPYGIAPREMKWVVLDDGRKRHLGPAEWKARGSRDGVPMTWDELGTLPDHP